MMINISNQSVLESYTNLYSKDPEFIAEGLALKITEEMLELLENRKLNQSWLAEKMGVSRAHVSQILNARPNMTLLTITKIAVALNVEPDVCLDTWNLNWCKPKSTNQTQRVDFIMAGSEADSPSFWSSEKTHEHITA